MYMAGLLAPRRSVGYVVFLFLSFFSSFSDLLTLSHGSVNHGKHAHSAGMWILIV